MFHSNPFLCFLPTLDYSIQYKLRYCDFFRKLEKTEYLQSESELSISSSSFFFSSNTFNWISFSGEYLKSSPVLSQFESKLISEPIEEKDSEKLNASEESFAFIGHGWDLSIWKFSLLSSSSNWTQFENLTVLAMFQDVFLLLTPH